MWNQYFYVSASWFRMGDYKLVDGFPGFYQGWYKPDQVDYGLYEDVSTNYTRPFFDKVMLFNLKGKLNRRCSWYLWSSSWFVKIRYFCFILDDPNEHVDLSKKHPDIVKKLKSRLEYYHKQIVPANFPSISPSSAPSNYGGFWTPGWC